MAAEERQKAQPKYIILVGDLWTLFGCFALLGLGGGLFHSPNNSEVMSALAAEKSHTASSVLATVRNMGMAFCVSLASILISLWLNGGAILSASHRLVSQSTSIVLIGAAVICAIGVATVLLW